MLLSWLWTGIAGISLIFGILNGVPLGTAPLEGAQSAITLALGMAGSLCLWSGAARVMEASGVTAGLARLFRPLLVRVFPSTAKNAALAQCLSANFCANLLGLGNAATPTGIQAAQHLKDGPRATDELCRLIVLNTASIQLIPANVAAVRCALGCATPFDILPAVWVTSLCSAGLGVAAAWLLGKLL